MDLETLTRLKRYTHVGTRLAPLLGKLAGQHYLGLEGAPDLDATRLKEVLGSLKGPLMKAAQLLATIPDMLPPEYRMELMTLQSGAPPMGAFFVGRRMRSELGPDWEQHFSYFDRTARYAASLGQVHYARLPSGQEVAVKLQYPNMPATIDADIQELAWVFGMYESVSPAIRAEKIQAEIAERLREEVDYCREARHIKKFQEIFENNSTVVVPAVIDALSTERLLTMSWQPGTPILHFKDADVTTRNRLATDLFKLWYTPLYHHGVLHGDPHPGNYSVDAEGRLVLYDFGCVRFFEPTFLDGVLALYDALKRNDTDAMADAYHHWGFHALSNELVDTLNLWAQYLYGPLLDDRIRPLDETHSSQTGQRIAGEVHAALKRLGGITPPREFVFMDRAAVGIGAVLMHLKAEANWHQLFEEIIEKSQRSAALQK